MTGYQCIYHDGEAEALHIHQTLGQPGVISVCGDCQPVYLFTSLAEVLGVDGGALYDVVRSYQVSEQQQGEPPAAPDADGEPPMPQGPHPAAVVTSGEVETWDWCACDAPGPHDQDGQWFTTAMLGQLREESCPHCGQNIRGTVDTIDEAIGDHLHSPGHSGYLEEQAAQS